MNTEVTELLLAWNRGEAGARDRLMPLVHAQLRGLARQHMAREQALTLQPTALVNEAYLRLVDLKRVRWTDKAHFFATAARVMRNVLVDRARARLRLKRGGEVRRVSLSVAMARATPADVDVLDLNRALEKLASFDARRSQVVELRLFGGLTIEETAVVLGVSGDTVTRDWKLARAWLARELGGGTETGPA